jgi:hypothetical protein
MTPLSRPQTFSALENLLAHRSNSCVADFAAFLSNVNTGENPAACLLQERVLTQHQSPG